MTRNLHTLVAAIAFALATALPAAAQSPKPEKSKVVMSVAGVSSQIYFLVPNLAARLGYFKDEGIELETVDSGSGAKGLQALVGGSADVTSGAYEHTIQMQAKGVDIRCIAQYGRSGGTVLAVMKAKAKSPASAKDLKGETVGVSAPGSSTHTFLNVVLGEAGLKPDDVSILGVGNAAGAVAAARSGRLGGISGVDPVMTELELGGDIVIIADARTAEGSRAVYGGPYASGCLYVPVEFIAKYPNTAQALANAITRTLRWIKKANIDEIIAALPPEYSRENPKLYRTAVERNLGGIPEIAVVEPEATKTVLQMAARADAKLEPSKIDLTKTYDNRFSQKASEKYK